MEDDYIPEEYRQHIYDAARQCAHEWDLASAIELYHDVINISVNGNLGIQYVHILFSKIPRETDKRQGLYVAYIPSLVNFHANVRSRVPLKWILRIYLPYPYSCEKRMTEERFYRIARKALYGAWKLTYRITTDMMAPDMMEPAR